MTKSNLRYYFCSVLIHAMVFLILFNLFKTKQNKFFNFYTANSSIEVNIFDIKKKVIENGFINKLSKDKHNQYLKAGIEELQARCLNNEPPRYPLLALKNGWQGTTILRFYIDKEGFLRNLVVQKSSGYPLLDKTAIKAAQNWAFSGGKTAVFVDYPVKFKLK